MLFDPDSANRIVAAIARVTDATVGQEVQSFATMNPYWS